MAKQPKPFIIHQKAALYVRVSTHWQIDKDSLPVQREELKSYAKYALGITDYEIFEDAGYSAKNTDRPAFQQMMVRLRTGEFSHLCVWKIDRISRNLLDFSEMYAELKKLGVTFVSKNEQFDTSNAMGEAMLKIILVFAELERNMTSERVTAVMLSLASNGQWNGGHVPFGYNYDKDSMTFSVNEQEAQIVRLIYDSYEEKRSLLAVARMLNDKNLTRQGKPPWNPVTVRIILVNPFYVGTYRYNHRDPINDTGNENKQIKDSSEWILIKDHHPAIVSEEQQQHVIEILQSQNRSNVSAKTYQRKNVHVFAGILFCGYCGSQMQSTVDRKRADGSRPSVYACSRKRRFNDCLNKYVSDITVGPFVFNLIANIIKAERSFGKSTSVQTFEKKLLRGPVFADVVSIDRQGMIELYNMIRYGGKSADLFSSSKTEAETIQLSDEYNLLMTEKRKKERALSRLKSLFLYSEDAMSEKDFILQSEEIASDLSKIDKRISEIKQAEAAKASISDDEFISRASIFIITNNLTEKRYIDFDKLRHSVTSEILKDFVQKVISKIVIKSGRITEISFMNGISLKFEY